jgi:PAS domain S-box-containing protein
METFMIDHMVQNTEQYEILIVDDTLDSLELLRHMLKEFGCRVRPATNSRHALKSVAARLPDLILLDVKMPDMDGYEVCRRIKSDEHSRNVPVIFISAYGETANKVEGFKAGGVDYITKPFEREEVLARVETQLRLRKLTEDLEQEVNQRTKELTQANQQLRHQIAERRRVEAELSWEVKVNQAAAELSHKLLSPTAIDDISHLMLEYARRLTGSAYGFVGYIIPETGYLVCPTHTRDIWDTCEVADKDIVFKEFTGLWGWVLTNRKALLTNAPADDPRSSGTPPGHVPIHRFLSVPALIDGTLVGQVSVANADHDYSDRELEVIKRLADLFAIAIQRQRAEESLRQSEERYRTIFQNSPLGKFRSKVDGKLLEVNKAFAKMFGYDSSDEALREIKKQGEEKYYRPEEKERILIEQLASTDSTQHQIRLWKKDGKEFFANLYQTTIFDTQGQPLFLDGIVEDISERKQAEEKRQESEERLQLTLEAAQIGIFDWDVEHDIWYASPEYYTMLGYEPQEGSGDRKQWLERVHPDDRAHVETKIGEVLARDSSADRPQVFAYEVRLRHADGTYRWQHIKGFGVKRDQQGRVTRMLGIRMDINERKAAEEALHRLNTELDQRVRERTVELEAANKELEAFAYSVSHDLRAPLRHIEGFMELLQKNAVSVLDEKSQDYMSAICDAATKMGQLIDDLLSFSRMGRQAISFQQVDLEKLVRGVIGELEPDTAGRNIAWCVGDLPAVDGDAAMLRMVLANLIDNAVKFTRPREKARIEIGSQSGRDAETVIFVRDNGVGFDMVYADKLFGVFQRLHRADEFEGTGIGLANAHRIITRHGGRTWAESRPDQGATFFFSLPSISKRRIKNGITD